MTRLVLAAAFAAALAAPAAAESSKCAALGDVAFALGERIGIRLIAEGSATPEVLQQVTIFEIADAGLLSDEEVQTIIRLGALAGVLGCDPS